jgi:hypothetical protein
MRLPEELTQITSTSKIVGFVMFIMIPLIYFFLGRNIGNVEGITTQAENFSALQTKTNTQQSEVELSGPNIVIDMPQNSAKKGVLQLAEGWHAKKITQYEWNTDALNTKQKITIAKDDYEINFAIINTVKDKCEIGNDTNNFNSFKDKDGHFYIRVLREHAYQVCSPHGSVTEQKLVNFFSLTPYGLITYKIPQSSSDKNILKEMDTMVATLKQIP